MGTAQVAASEEGVLDELAEDVLDREHALLHELGVPAGDLDGHVGRARHRATGAAEGDGPGTDALGGGEGAGHVDGVPAGADAGLLRAAIPGRLGELFVLQKRSEWADFLGTVTEWDVHRYLDATP